MDIVTPSRVGARTEAAVASALARHGFDVYLPAFSVNGRVDLVYDRAGVLRRVQCKTARRSGATIAFHTTSLTGNVAVPYDGQIDEFGVFAPSSGLVYLVPLAEVPRFTCFLRIEPSRNGQTAKIRWAKDYELGPP